MPNFDYEIVKHVATLSKNETGNYSVEVNLISYNGSEPKVDIRKWDKLHDKMLKGVVLTMDEAKTLHEALETIIDSE